jgi:UDP-N-acetylmuramate--alanine ligase
MIRDRRPGFRMEIEELVLPMPGPAQRLETPTAAIAVAPRAGVSRTRSAARSGRSAA